MHWTSIQLAVAAVLAISPGMLRACDPPNAHDDRSPSTEEQHLLLRRVIANEHHNDAASNLFEHIEHRRARRTAEDSSLMVQDQVFRVFPTSTGTDKIPVQPDGRPVDPVTYAEELRKLEKALALAANPNSHAQRDALMRYNKKQKERAELVDAALEAFIFTWLGRENVAGHTLAKFHLDPNPAYKPASRATGMFSHLRATVWLDESAAQLTRVDAEIFEDMAFGGGLLAKVYKGGRFILEQAEVAPGIWFPVLYDYNFDGRKFLFTMAVHVRTKLKQYKRVGPPEETLALIRAELNKLQQARPSR